VKASYRGTVKPLSTIYMIWGSAAKCRNLAVKKVYGILSIAKGGSVSVCLSVRLSHSWSKPKPFNTQKYISYHTIEQYF